jgi:hypothetical protein
MLKSCGLKEKTKYEHHQLSLELRFDALRQTPIDAMHRELLGLVKLHFQCIWATFDKENKKTLAERIAK